MLVSLFVLFRISNFRRYATIIFTPDFTSPIFVSVKCRTSHSDPSCAVTYIRRIFRTLTISATEFLVGVQHWLATQFLFVLHNLLVSYSYSNIFVGAIHITVYATVVHYSIFDIVGHIFCHIIIVIFACGASTVHHSVLISYWSFSSTITLARLNLNASILYSVLYNSWPKLYKRRTTLQCTLKLFIACRI